MPAPSLDRRAALRLALLSLALGGGGGLLAACGDDAGGRPKPGQDPDGIELVSSEASRAPGDPAVLPDVVAGLQAFGGDLYGQLAGDEGNLVLSPYSVLVALGMTMAGAAGRTAEEMAAVLHTGGLGDRWHEGVNALTAHVDGLAGEQERSDGTTAEIALATANQLFGQEGVGWEDDFLDVLARQYGAGLRAVDFATETAKARTLINDWVEQQTDDRIEDLVPQGVLDAATRLVLVNAVYLKAPWEHTFDKELTATGSFRRADGSTVDVDLMHRPDLSGGLVTGDGWRAAVLPYAGSGLAMTVVLPDDAGLAAVEEQVVAEGLGPLLAGAQPQVLDISLPRWSFRAQASLRDALTALGMRAAFTDADFTPMTEEDLDLVVSHVLHQGFIAVDEEGTEAAAATAVVMRETSAPVAVEFVVDRPFLFVIHDVEHGAPLFVGRVSDPTA
ncbi:serpin family protein [Nocardioides sp. SYSU DS0651]|uniref:serpin family protein n=1 Tax=Nocardioides sp. SYSU DS0651 TaxID=3415955 RepID=UPI003F4B96D8